LKLFRFHARKMAQDPQTTHGSTAYGVHRTEPNVSEDLLMDLKCHDSREFRTTILEKIIHLLFIEWTPAPAPTVSSHASAHIMSSMDDCII
jgi:hypothetical protein